mmetsp:Transcript_107374/g.334696  ORF Transcript_107374/g.334696 Transcript_107374/m.334696 type:complete len:261 (-) Transcript_107374:659-1441(-)
MARSTTSACRAAATASSMPPSNGASARQPRTTASAPGSASAPRMPASMFTILLLSPNSAQVPSRFFVSVAYGPMSATRCPDFCSGRTPLSFFSRTIERLPASLASRWCSSVSYFRSEASDRYGFSKSPRAAFTRSTRRTSSLTSSAGTSPFATRSGRCSLYRLLSMLMSRPAKADFLAASRPSAAYPWSMSSRSAVKSETTKPRKLHSPRRMSVNSQRFAVAGTPAISLKALMTVTAPASKDALNAGKWTSRKVASEIST